ncbi:MAG: methyltransferase domain-containing protein [Alphaproteobacteria bacterium]|nr:methyltransferase domain-containing protein [Alphaproteobacteria bacterium]
MEEPLEPQAESYIEKRNHLLEGIDPDTIRKAWFTLSHLLLDEGAKVIDMGCDDGAMTYAMAVLNPKASFTGLDKSKKQINKAKEKYKLFNLEFKIGDASSEIFEPESLDAVINSYVLHEIYSSSRYNERIVSDTLTKQFSMLKKGGMMFIRDYARPPPGEFVLMEMPDKPGTGKTLTELSEADLLLWYSEHARPRQDPGCGGFFLEELPERVPRTRLFRLPYKWAYEFIMRKNDRMRWETELPMEYTFFTMREFRKELRALGARVQYSGPYWDEDIINEQFETSFRLYSDDGAPLGHPPTCYIAVATKMAERKSLNIEERRPSHTDSGHLKISAVRDKDTGKIMDIVSRDISISEVIPYHIDEEGRLKIYLHDGVARSISNAVPRSGTNIDGRLWSGHMLEPVSVDGEAMAVMEALDIKNSVKFARDYLGLKPTQNAVLEHGPDYYPAPDYIDEKIQTFYLRVQSLKKTITPKSFAGHSGKFQARGEIRELDAQQVLNAITVGLIPSARLEMQILSLFQHVGIKAETWSDKVLNLKISKLKDKADLLEITQLFGESDTRFKDIKGTAGQIRAIHSTFVEEGQTRGVVSGLSAENVDFIVQDDKTINTAVVLPLAEGLKGEIHAGFTIQHLPVPQRHEGNGTTISAPSYNIPPNVTNQRELKKFLADKLGVAPNTIIKLGESYFSHIGMTPQRIYPFAVTAPPETLNAPGTKFIPFYQYMLLQRLISREPHFFIAIARAYRYFHEDIRFDSARQVKAIIKERFSKMQPDWSLPLSYERVHVAERSRTPKPVTIEEAPDAKQKKQALDAAAKTAAAKTAKASAYVPFHAQNKEQAAKIVHEREEWDKELQRDKELAQAKAQEATKKQPPPKPKIDMDLTGEFASEIEDFLDALEKVDYLELRPEKW